MMLIAAFVSPYLISSQSVYTGLQFNLPQTFTENKNRWAVDTIQRRYIAQKSAASLTENVKMFLFL